MATSEIAYRNILVIRLSAMGDVAMVVPVLSALVQQNPEIKITVLTRAFLKPLFSQLKNVVVFEADLRGRHKGIMGLYRLFQELKKQGIDAVADLHHVLRSNILKGFFTLDGTPFYQMDKGRSEKKKLTASKNKIFKPLKSTHQRYADVFITMGLQIDLSIAPLLFKETAADTIIKIMGSEPKKWLGIVPFAAHEGKMYPLQLMQEVIVSLSKTEKYKIVLFGGGEEEKLLLQAIADTNESCINISGRISFTQELALISNLDLMLSMDSANGHLAAMYGIPTVTLWGVTHPFAGFAPFRQDENHSLLADRTKFPLIPTSIYGNKVPAGYENVMETILPNHVIAKIHQALGDA